MNFLHDASITKAPQHHSVVKSKSMNKVLRSLLVCGLALQALCLSSGTSAFGEIKINNGKPSSSKTDVIKIIMGDKKTESKTSGKSTINKDLAKELFSLGTGSSGGGQGIIYSNGQVRFLDFVSHDELPTSTISQTTYNSIMYPQQKVRTLGKEVNNFFECSNDILAKFGETYPVIKRLVSRLNKVNPIMVKFPLYNISSNGVNFMDKHFSNLKIPFYTEASPSALSEIQNPLAVYNYGRLWISEPLYSRLSAEEQCGLAVHESLRHLNHLNLIENAMTTYEIEVLTRYFFNINFENDNEIISSVLEKIAKEISSSENYREMAKKALEDAKKIDDYLYANYNSLSDKRRKELDDQSWALINQSSMYTTLSVSSILSQTADSAGQLMIREKSIEQWILNDHGLINLKTLEYVSENEHEREKEGK